MVVEAESDRLRQLDRQLLGVCAEIEVLESKLKTDDVVPISNIFRFFPQILIFIVKNSSRRRFYRLSSKIVLLSAALRKCVNDARSQRHNQFRANN